MRAGLRRVSVQGRESDGGDGGGMDVVGLDVAVDQWREQNASRRFLDLIACTQASRSLFSTNESKSAMSRQSRSDGTGSHHECSGRLKIGK